MPSAPSALSCGMISRTTLSSMIVSSASQPALLKGETVGLRNDGTALMIASSASFGAFILSPTLDSASNAPLSRRAIVSILRFLTGSAQLFRLAMNLMFVSKSVSTIRSLLARRELPVSVMSTIASTRSGTFTSVAPQENSTVTGTLLAAKYRFTVLTSSVATRLPANCSAFWIGEDSGTHRTQRDFCVEARL